MRKNAKFLLGGAAGFVVLVACTLAVTLAVSLPGREVSTDVEEPKTSDEILTELRSLMRREDVAIDAYIITSVDAHQSEYISTGDQRIHYVSGFSGSAGTVVITADEALLWTDSRYHIQAEDQLYESWTLKKAGNVGVETYQDWLTHNLATGSVVGIDPKLIDSSSYLALSMYLSAAGYTLKSVDKNLVDLVWTDKEPPHYEEIIALPYEFSGRRISEKLADVRREMTVLGVQSHIVTALDDIAWLLNLRGLDIPYNPVFFAYVILTSDKVRLYVLEPSRITPNIREHFQEEGVEDEIEVFDYDLTKAGLADIVANTNGQILMYKTSQDIYETVPAARRVERTSPIVLLKVVKNQIEANGMRQANIRDGAAVIQYLCWLSRNIDTEVVTELSGARKLAEFRAKQEYFRGLSFEAISAVGSNAAMAHYSPTEETAAVIDKSKIYLLDSGGQYFDGTTDTTRTVHFGVPSDFEKEAFTRVLKGFISMGSAKFPNRAPFSFFDAMARRALWDVGLNYGHGTGHGIGAYLNVHEYPPLISSGNGEPGMIENMFTSNEPGFYKEGEFGIRIEDVVQAIPAPELKGNFDNVGALQFYHITMVPIQTSLIKTDLLTPQEIDWLNEYHERVLTNTDPVLESLGDDDAREWLREQTKPIVHDHCSV
ncbi:xaa-Pro aminopeptidase ApepP-like [Bradysia coprophila]|uniref:xaa-Pro aminopeptidase ApepP-like n=1 Tax=Bradysia coprophila TaxID=38358 RepID=UPI00187DAD45|nr:xaa-Pro aminopeptidase ApepP-like [Bradysia coprophila]